MGGSGCDDFPNYADHRAAAAQASGAARLKPASAASETPPARGDPRASVEVLERPAPVMEEAWRKGRKVMSRPAGSDPPPRSGLKRSSRGSPKGAAARRAAVEEPIGRVDHSFSYEYGEKDIQFLGNRVECGRLAASIRGGYEDFPAPESLRGVNCYREWSSRQFQALSAGNRMVQWYEQRCREAEEGASSSKAALETQERQTQAERKRADKEKKRADELEARLSESEGKFATEQKRLRDSRNLAIQAEQRKYDAQIRDLRKRIARLCKHIRSLEARERPRLLLVQAKGLKSCLDAMVADGSDPSSQIAQVESDLESFEAQLAEFPVFRPLEGDLEIPPGFEDVEGDDGAA